jgi:hypothetical protein
VETGEGTSRREAFTGVRRGYQGEEKAREII